MPAYYLDSSALVKRYVAESGTDHVIQISSDATKVAVSAITQIEVVSAATRRSRGGDIAAEDLNRIKAVVEADFQHFSGVTFDSNSVTECLTLVERHGLRAADAIQLHGLATARKSHQVTCLVSADEELNVAALAEGFDVVVPSDKLINQGDDSNPETEG